MCGSSMRRGCGALDGASQRRLPAAPARASPGAFVQTGSSLWSSSDPTGLGNPPLLPVTTNHAHCRPVTWVGGMNSKLWKVMGGARSHLPPPQVCGYGSNPPAPPERHPCRVNCPPSPSSQIPSRYTLISTARAEFHLPCSPLCPHIHPLALRPRTAE